MIIYQCPNCHGTLKDGTIVWSCDDGHPEVLAQMDKQDEDDEEEETPPEDVDDTCIR